MERGESNGSGSKFAQTNSCSLVAEAGAMSGPTWLAEARKHIGTREVPGPSHNPKIIQWLTRLGAWWKDDETPWCGTFVAHCVEASGMSLPKHWYRAKAWADWGVRTNPVLGCVVVMERDGGGHVGFAVGVDAQTVQVLGGNQGNEVNIRSFPVGRIIAYRWPMEAGNPNTPLPVMKAGKTTGEA